MQALNNRALTYLLSNMPKWTTSMHLKWATSSYPLNPVCASFIKLTSGQVRSSKRATKFLQPQQCNSDLTILGGNGQSGPP